MDIVCTRIYPGKLSMCVQRVYMKLFVCTMCEQDLFVWTLCVQIIVNVLFTMDVGRRGSRALWCDMRGKQEINRQKDKKQNQLRRNSI